VPALIKRFVAAAKEGSRDVTVWGTGKASRDFLYVGDCARGIADALDMYDEPEPMNLASCVSTPIADLVTKIRQITGYQGSVEWDASKPDGYANRCLDIQRAQRHIGFSPSVSLDDGLQTTIEEYNHAACQHSVTS
jgi:GDP-L-fucose synthase